MKLIKMECPYCGAKLEVEDGQKVVTCEYCGKQFAIDDGIQRSEVTIKDEAKIKEAELKQKQYQDNQEEKKNKEKKAFRISKGFKLIIVLLIISFLGAAIAFNESKVLAGILALVQIALLVMAILTGTGAINKIHGIKIPAIIYIVVSIVLTIPYMRLYNRKESSRNEMRDLAWPSSGLALRIPEPSSTKGEVSIDNDSLFSADIYKLSEADFNTYRDACIEKGFSEDSKRNAGFYTAYDSEGYQLTLNYMDSEDEMDITLKVPEVYTDFSWPVSDLASILPEPVSKTGKIYSNDSDHLNMAVADTDSAAFKNYVQSCIDAGFNVDYSSGDTYFNASNAQGYELDLNENERSVMSIYLDAPDESVETATPEPSAQVSDEVVAATVDPDTILDEDGGNATDILSNIGKDITSIVDTFTGGYEEIYNEYSKRMTDRTPQLINEYNNEAASNTNGINGLAEICTNKINVLAEIDTEGTEKMAEYMYTGGLGNYNDYESWASKLYDVYETEATKITDVYMSSATSGY